MKRKNLIRALKTFTVSVLILGLIITAPGLPCYQALAAGVVSTTGTMGNSAWLLGFAPSPASSTIIEGMKSALKTEAGRNLALQNPSLRLLAGMDPASALNQHATGIMAKYLPVTVTAQAIETAYKQAAPEVEKGIHQRTEELAKAVLYEVVTPNELSQAVSELRAFAFMGAEVQKDISFVQEMARAARSGETMAAAHKMAEKFLGVRSVSESAENISVVDASHQTDLVRPTLKPALESMVKKGANQDVTGDHGLELLQTFLNAQTKPQVAIQSIDQLASLIKKSPTAVSPSLEEAMRVAIKTFLGEVIGKRKVENKRESMEVHITRIDNTDISKVDGKSVPTRRIRALFDLYEQLVVATPDLVSKEMKDVILDGLRFNAKLIGWRDSEGDNVTLWTMKRLVGIGQIISQKRTDLIELQDFPSFYGNIEAKKHDLSPLDNDIAVFLIVSTLVWFVLLMIAPGLIESLFSSKTIDYLWYVPITLQVLLTGLWAHNVIGKFRDNSRTRRSVPPLQDLVVQMFHQRALTNSPEDVLDIIGLWNEENGKWGPKKGFEKLFDTLTAQWPEFKATVENAYTQLIQKTMQRSPQEVLDEIGYVDEERIEWSPKKGHEKMYRALKEQWPEFRTAISKLKDEIKVHKK